MTSKHRSPVSQSASYWPVRQSDARARGLWQSRRISTRLSPFYISIIGGLASHTRLAISLGRCLAASSGVLAAIARQAVEVPASPQATISLIFVLHLPRSRSPSPTSVPVLSDLPARFLHSPSFWLFSLTYLSPSHPHLPQSSLGPLTCLRPSLASPARSPWPPASPTVPGAYAHAPA